MNRSFIILIFYHSLILFSCSKTNQDDDWKVASTWIELQKKGNDFVLVDCNYHSQLIRVGEKEIREVGTMEDDVNEIHHIKQGEKDCYYYLNKEESAFYRYEWLDKEKGLAKWTIKYPNVTNTLTRFYCDSLKLNKFKQQKGDGTDCITNEDATVNENKSENKLWVGEYLFRKTFSRQDSEDSVVIKLSIVKDKAFIRTTVNNEEVVNTSKEYVMSNDSLIIRYNKNNDYYEDEYILLKNDTSYFIAGLSIYMLNPPNSDYPIQKSQ
ncbi:MAG: hypothetical protein H7329_02890 [Opitutaceae bacterium]|nr:hypothetical protein [Cytophagales bacterium]